MDKPLSLAGLHDIVLPEAPPLWPPAAGFWVLFFLAIVLAVSAAHYSLQKRRRDAYRRAGLVELERVRTVHDVSVILKRVALAAWPRGQVASLYGREWARFLNAHCRGCHFDEEEWRRPDSAVDPALRGKKAHWIARHLPGTVASDE